MTISERIREAGAIADEVEALEADRGRLDCLDARSPDGYYWHNGDLCYAGPGCGKPIRQLIDETVAEQAANGGGAGAGE